MPTVNPFFTGSLLGLGAALAGMPPIIGGFRPWHLLVIGAFAIVLHGRGLDALLRLRVTSFDLIFVAFIFLSSVVEVVNARSLYYEAGIVSVLTDIFYLLAYLTARLSITEVQSCYKFLSGIIWPAVPVALLGLAQVLNMGNIVEFSLTIAPADAVDSRAERGSFPRAWGLTGHWTGFGGYLTCVIAAQMCLILIKYGRDTTLRKRDLGVLFTLLIGVFSTLTISVIAASVAIILVSWRKLRSGVKGIVALAGFSVVALAVLAPQMATRLDQQLTSSVTGAGYPEWVPSTLVYRLFIWQTETIPAIAERPFAGWGQGSYAKDTIGRIYPGEISWGSPESQWLGLAMGYGVFVAVVFFLLLVLVGIVLRSLSRMDSLGWTEPIWVLWIALMLTSLTVSVFTNRGTPSVLYVLVGVGIAIVESRRTEKGPPARVQVM